MMPEMTYQRNKSNQMNIYKQQEIAVSTPERTILHLYDIAIQSCITGEEDRAGKAIALLIDGLNFEVGNDIASRLFRLYEYCLVSIHDKKYEDARSILKELRSTWRKALESQIAEVA